MDSFDIAVIGGGVVGLSVAYGIAKNHSASVAIFDEGDVSYKASRSNFGLIWFQGKGIGIQNYVQLVRHATKGWAVFADELEIGSGVDMGYHQAGGLKLCLGEDGARARKETVRALIEQGGDEGYECEFLDRQQLENLFGSLRLGDEVQTASFSPLDGHVNPLYLLIALQKQVVNLGAKYIGGNRVESIEPTNGGGFEINTNGRKFAADRVFLAGGLANSKIGRDVGINIELKPERGQILVTQRTKQMFPLPLNGFRQTDEGSIMLGSSAESVGLNDMTTPNVIEMIANQAVRTFPDLAKLHLQRAWGGLRTHSPDHLPIYAASTKYPGAFAGNCHSGITLASYHAEVLPDWIMTGNSGPLLNSFSSERFNA